MASASAVLPIKLIICSCRLRRLTCMASSGCMACVFSRRTESGEIAWRYRCRHWRRSLGYLSRSRSLTERTPKRTTSDREGTPEEPAPACIVTPQPTPIMKNRQKRAWVLTNCLRFCSRTFPIALVALSVGHFHWSIRTLPPIVVWHLLVFGRRRVYPVGPVASPVHIGNSRPRGR